MPLRIHPATSIFQKIFFWFLLNLVIVAATLAVFFAFQSQVGPIQVKVEKRADTVPLTVEDQGPGVASQNLDRLFELFFRPEPSRDRDSGGVGLGLAIVKTCIETCKGSVSAANLKPNGFAVTIRLPAGRSA
jgi:two-component system, OmpR family, sensor histidine kinase CpxA